MLKTTLLLAVAASALVAADVKSEFLDEVSALEKKYTSLAEAIPADKYTWRPGDGVRSISEAFMHVAGANYMLPRMVGVTPPQGLERGMEKSVTAKAEVIAQLRKSFEHVRAAAQASAEPDKMIKLFGREVSQRYFLTFLAHHMHEHLGQLIAYARMNKVTPPWSQG
ncbi:MAG TPA: DinB family protein [Bryobacteraceae bacterium]|nr:DinB family protein [Bryobacteraceae bacterium]